MSTTVSDVLKERGRGDFCNLNIGKHWFNKKAKINAIKKKKVKGIIIIRKTPSHRTYAYNGKIFVGVGNENI